MGYHGMPTWANDIGPWNILKLGSGTRSVCTTVLEECHTAWQPRLKKRVPTVGPLGAKGVGRFGTSWEPSDQRGPFRILPCAQSLWEDPVIVGRRPVADAGVRR